MASITKRGNGLWRARYRDDVEKEHAKHFDRKVDAQRWLNEVTASLVTGSYVDPKAGLVTFERFYALWSQRQVWVPSTRVNADHAAASVPFAQVPLKSLRRPRRGVGQGDDQDVEDARLPCRSPRSSRSAGFWALPTTTSGRS
jgi:hypothetical protein